MTPQRWARIKEVVADALDVKREARPAFLAQACGEDVDLRANVETLLRGDEPGASFLNLDREPERLGAWRVVREIGRGGMGTVYLAERDDGHFEQRAAIKVIKRGMDTDAVLRRFYAERQILARLEHPNITRLLDGGTFDHRPYFVMEYLEGEPLADYCTRTSATIAQRIALFLAVCDAVEHAHRNLILHRDLKAGNILVDRTGTPKLLDFGIAKALEEDGSTEQTVLAGRAMTPQAASPEQIRGEALTTASDVYALGLLLYELLAGKPAYLVPANSPADLQRLVCDTVPPKPSALADPETARTLRGDLDNIILKALEKDTVRRYQRAAELAADLRRYLEGMPVEARSGGTGYRARKFISRHRRSLAVAALVLIAITAATANALVQGRRAQRRFDDLRQLAGTFLFEFHDAIAGLPGSTPARELVTRRALQYLDNLSRESASDRNLKLEVAEGYLRVGAAQGLAFESNLGKVTEARASFEKARSIFEALRKESPDDVRVVVGLAASMLSLNTTNTRDTAGALAINQRVAAMLEDAGKRHPLDVPGQVVLGKAYFGVAERLADSKLLPESIQARQKAIEMFRQLSAHHPEEPDGPRFLAQSEKRLAYLYITQLHDLPKAAEALKDSYRIDQIRLAKDPGSAVVKLDLALDESYLATLMLRSGDVEGALQFQESAVMARDEVLRADPRNVRVRYLLINSFARWGAMLRDGKQAAEARSAFERGMKVAREGDERAMSAPDGIAAVQDLERESKAPIRHVRADSPGRGAGRPESKREMSQRH